MGASPFPSQVIIGAVSQDCHMLVVAGESGGGPEAPQLTAWRGGDGRASVAAAAVLGRPVCPEVSEAAFPSHLIRCGCQ